VEGIVTELRQRCKVIISLAAVKQSFSLEADLADIEIPRDSKSRVESAFAHRSAAARA